MELPSEGVPWEGDRLWLEGVQWVLLQREGHRRGVFLVGTRVGPWVWQGEELHLAGGRRAERWGAVLVPGPVWRCVQRAGCCRMPRWAAASRAACD